VITVVPSVVTVFPFSSVVSVVNTEVSVLGAAMVVLTSVVMVLPLPSVVVTFTTVSTGRRLSMADSRALTSSLNSDGIASSNHWGGSVALRAEKMMDETSPVTDADEAAGPMEAVRTFHLSEGM